MLYINGLYLKITTGESILLRLYSLVTLLEATLYFLSYVDDVTIFLTNGSAIVQFTTA